MNVKHGAYLLLFLTINLMLEYALAIDIFAEVQKDSMAGIKQALTENPKIINSRGPGEQTPLMHAVLQGKVKAVKYLLKKGADVTIGEKDGYTPMHGAGFQGRAEIGQLLIAHGINPSDKHTDGFQPIQRACWGREPRHTETVKMFLLNNVWNADIHKSCLTSPNAATKRLIEQHAASKMGEEL